MTETGSQVALWYFRYHKLEYELCGSEEKAAVLAVGMVDSGGSVIAGVQFSDGRPPLAADDWPAFNEAQAEFDAYHAEQVTEPPRHYIMTPFGVASVGEDAPSWLSIPVEHKHL
jgi:hypothetical protein